MVTDLIVNCQESIEGFVAYIANPSLPTIDIENVLHLVCGAVGFEKNNDDKLYCLAEKMAFGDRLIENNTLAFSQQEELFNELLHLGGEIKQHLKDLKAYDETGDSTLPYVLFEVRVAGDLHFKSSVHYQEYLDKRYPGRNKTPVSAH